MKQLRALSVYLIPLLMSVMTFVACGYATLYLNWNIPDFFAKNMRGSLFAGFLTLGSFLLTLKTGIVIKIKEGLYDSTAYKKRLIEQRQINKQLSAYGPLRRLSRLLSWSVFSALISAAFQLTIGLIPHWIAATLCLAIAVFAMSILLSSFFLIQINLSDWFNLMEENDTPEENPTDTDTTRK